MAEQNLILFEKALKEHYLPAWRNQLSTEPSAILGKIKVVPLVSNKIVATAPIGLSGGFGFGAEGAATPTAGGVKFNRFETTAKDMYVDIGISTKAVRLTKNGGAMANALDTEVKGAYETAKWNVGRALFGNGEGILTNITAVADNVLTVASTANVKEGLIVDLYTTEEEKSTTVRVVAVDRSAKAVTVEGEVKITTGFMTVQNSYKREITGFGAIFDDNIDELYGVKKSVNQYLKPVVVDAEGDLDDGTITKALRYAGKDKNSQIDVICCGDDAYDHYVNYLRTNNVRVEEISKTLKGGFKAIKFIHGNKEVEIINEGFVPANEMWGFDTTALELHIQDWDFATLQGGSIFTLVPGTSVYNALLANYGELMCKNPGGCVRIINCAKTA